MAQITTTYDVDLKQKIFQVRGEEGYARTTDCKLDELTRRNDWNTHMEYMLIGFHVDVLRDVGASSVALYDNDVLIEGTLVELDTNSHSIDWDWSVSEDNRIKLNYEVEHHIVAKYNGNKQCLPSESKEYVFYEPIPQAYESEVIINDLSDNHDSGVPVTFTVTLGATGHYDEQLIQIYDNSEWIGEYETNEYGVTPEISFTPSHDGMHIIKAVFEGNTEQSKELAYSEVSQDISVGYVVSILDAPTRLINIPQSNLTAMVVDYFDNPQSSFSVDIMEDGGSTPLKSSTTGDDGIASFVNVPLSNTEYYACTSHNSVDYESEHYVTSVYTNVTIDYSVDTTITSTNFGIVGSAQLSEPISNVPVTTPNGSVVYTDDNGSVSTGLSYSGKGAGNVTLTASITGSSDSVAIEDVYQYWNLSTPMNIDYTLVWGSVSKKTNGWQLTASSGGVYFQLNNKPSYVYNWVIEYDIVAVSNTITSVDVGDTQFIPISLKANDHIKQEVSYTNRNAKYYKNGTLIATKGWRETPRVSYHTDNNTISGYLIINNLKFKRL